LGIAVYQARGKAAFSNRENENQQGGSMPGIQILYWGSRYQAKGKSQQFKGKGQHFGIVE
jgi:hypothetical protein